MLWSAFPEPFFVLTDTNISAAQYGPSKNHTVSVEYHAGEHVRPVTLSPVIPTTQQGKRLLHPVSLLIPGFALVNVGIIVLMRKRRE
jgi:hypothetical protein